MFYVNVCISSAEWDHIHKRPTTIVLDFSIWKAHGDLCIARRSNKDI